MSGISWRIALGRSFGDDARPRAVVLAAGRRVAVPDVEIGSDGYLRRLNKAPAHTCDCKTINALQDN
jgi:hypothetical protein